MSFKLNILMKPVKHVKRKNKLAKWIIIGFLIFLIFNYLFILVPLNGKYPAEMVNAVNELNKTSDNMLFAKQVYDYVNKKYTSPPFRYLVQYDRVLVRNINKIWNLEGYLPCNSQLDLFKKMLILSGRFTKDDIKNKYGWCIITPHEWIELNVNEKSVLVDLWGADHDAQFGQRYSLPCNDKGDLVGVPVEFKNETG